MYIGIVILIKSASSTKLSLIFSVLQFLNGVQVLNVICVTAVSGWFLWLGLSPAAAIVLLTAKFYVTKIYASD